MITVWQNATETEVYAASLLLAVFAILAADRAGRTGDRKWTFLAGYLLAPWAMQGWMVASGLAGLVGMVMFALWAGRPYIP